MIWTKIAKEGTFSLGWITGFDVEKFVKTGEKIEGKRVELKIGEKEFTEYYEHLKMLYKKHGTSPSGIDALLDDRKRQDLHNKATESVLRNTFSKNVMEYYKSQESGLTGLNFKIRQMINDNASEMMQYSVMAKTKNWLKIKGFQIDPEKNEQKNIDEVFVNTFKEDKEGEGEEQFFGYERNRSKEQKTDKSPVLSEEDSLRKENMPAIDDYGNTRKI